MVHALHEAHRVLRTDGLLIDLRPGAVHRRVGIAKDGRHLHLGTLREKLDDDRAANRAIAQVLREGLFQSEWRTQFDCRRVMDSPDDFQMFLDEFTTLFKKDFPPHDWLFRRVKKAFNTTRGHKAIVVSGPLVLRLLRKLNR
jgi:hypothetical protein